MPNRPPGWSIRYGQEASRTSISGEALPAAIAVNDSEGLPYHGAVRNLAVGPLAL